MRLTSLLVAIFSICFFSAMALHALEPNRSSGNNTCGCYDPPTPDAGKPILYVTRVISSVPSSCFPMGVTSLGSVIALGIAYALDRKNEAKEPWNGVGLTSKGFGAGGLALIFQTWNHLTTCLTAVLFNPDTVTSTAK
jgi:hypothetical protein